MTEREFHWQDNAKPQLWQAWLTVCREQRLDQWRHRLAAGEVIEALRCKGLKVSNQMKPYFARKFNAMYDDGGLLFVTRATRREGRERRTS